MICGPCWRVGYEKDLALQKGNDRATQQMVQKRDCSAGILSSLVDSHSGPKKMQVTFIASTLTAP